MYAIFRAKGKQFRAEPDSRVRLPSLEAEPGDRITFDEVLLTSAEGEVTVGTPSVPGASIDVEVLRHGKGEKIVVFKMKRRKNYRRKQGHRQKFTEVRVVEISLPGDGAARKRAREEEPEAPAAEEDRSAESAEAAEPEAATDVDITDAAQDLADEHGIDPSGLEGSGKDGRILKGDVERAIERQQDDEPSSEDEEGT